MSSETESNEYALHEACRQGKPLTVKSILSNNPKAVLVKDEDGRIPLHWATSFQQLEIVSMLLSPWKFPSDPKKTKKFAIDIDDFTDDAGWTALHIASSVGNLEVFEHLLANDPAPDVNLQTNAGVTCLHLAVTKSNIDIVNILLEKGASARIKDNKGQYPIHRAVTIGSMALTETLAKKGKSPLNAKDVCGWTPLHHALAEGSGDVAVLLVKLGADYQIEDNEGETPIAVAVDDNVRKFFVSELKKDGVNI
ncbi:hypothetical protein WICPIJ_003679 [Wickerhamomyces pijperi]|uniref:26S proteasome regulatory subunit p28 n=1 Tax=Wickerhamomyces pijperi TaxID=599730 RepID=A0A9P8Q7D6_WICPI|nr:hypothetical protein WICPIJ_003679 [Wickerhamomyces pijperi]